MAAAIGYNHYGGFGMRLKVMVVATTSAILAAFAAFVAPEAAWAADSTTVGTAAVSAALNSGDRALVVHDPSNKLTVHNGTLVAAKGNSSVTFGLPYKDAAGIIKAGFAIPGHDGAASAVIPSGGGDLQMLAVINTPKAPASYSYTLGNARGVLLPSGAVLVTNGMDKPIGVITPPWAHDRNGVAVPTHFTVSADGHSLTQVVNHRGGRYAYPVLADPSFHWYWNGVVVTFSYSEMAAVAIGGLSVMEGMLLVPGIGWAMILAVAGAVAYASWAYGHHKCYWFWLVYFVVGSSWGFYDC